MGTGVAYWDTKDATLNAFGKHAVRHAAGLAYIEAIDASWLAISEAIVAQSQVDPATFWGEKKIPRWMRYGAASYVERYYEDKDVQADPWQVRKWAVTNLMAGGGLRKLDDIFAMELSLEDIEGSTRMIHEAGLLVSFMLDGGCEKVVEAHQAFKEVLMKGEDTAEAVEELQKVLKKNEKDLKKYAQQ